MMILNPYSKLDKLKKEHNAIILVHYYQNLDIKDVADIIGDSLELAKQATQINAEIIFFCSIQAFILLVKLVALS